MEYATCPLIVPLLLILFLLAMLFGACVFLRRIRRFPVESKLLARRNKLQFPSKNLHHAFEVPQAAAGKTVTLLLAISISGLCAT
jgi:hypothetical protein